MSDLNFLDLVVMQRIDENSTVEKFGTIINTSFFEAANMLGTLKVKGYIEIVSSVAGNSQITLTEAGASILQNAAGKTDDAVDALDNAIMKTLASGLRDLDKLQEALNIRSSDLAYHLYKLEKQGYIHYEIRSAKVGLTLTEKGFNLTGGFRAVEQKPVAGEAEKEAHDIIKAPVPPSAPVPAKVPSPPPEQGAPPWANLGNMLKPKQKPAVELKPAQQVSNAPAMAAPQPAVQTTLPSGTQQAQKDATKSDMLLSKYGYYAQKYAIPIVLGIALGLAAGYYFFLQGKV